MRGGTVGEWVARHARGRGEAVFLVCPDGGRVVRWGEVPAALGAVAALVRRLGVGRGERLGVMMGNGWTAAQVLLGAMACGRVVLPLNLAAGDAQLAFALRCGGCRAVVVDAENAVRGRAVAEGLDVRVEVVGRDAGIEGGGGAVEVESDGEALALLMFTSGTTGMPKGVAHSHGSLLAGAGNVVAAHELTAADRGYCVLPLYHINALCVSLLSAVVTGGSLVLPHRFRTADFWRHVADFGCTWFSVVPTLAGYLLREEEGEAAPAMPLLRFGRSASAPLAAEVWRGFEARFGVPLIETMGLTETAAQILANPLPPAVRKGGSPGIPFGCEVAVLDAAGAVCGVGVAGEIAVRGANVMRGYWGDEAATAAAFGGDGWLLTGDLGVRDADGYFFVTGRRKELIIKGGENIAPREIDEALLLRAEVADAAAFGQPCERYGQRVCAAVILREGAVGDEAALVAHCREVVGGFKAPDRVYFVSDFPRGASGKVQRSGFLGRGVS